MVAIFVVAFIMLALAMELYIARRGSPTEPLRSRTPLPMDMPGLPESVFLAPNHTWVRMTTEGTLQVGIDDLVAQAIGDVESVWVPQPGTKLRAGDPLMKLRVQARELTVHSPSDGVVESFNDRAVSAPWLIVHDPYRAGWIVSVTPDNYEATISPLRMGASAVAWLRNEMTRLVELVSVDTRVAGAPVLADGAVPLRGVASGLNDGAWTAFQQQFVQAAAEKR